MRVHTCAERLPVDRLSNMNAFYDFISPILGLGAEPKDLTFLQISLRGTIVLIFTLILVRLGDKRTLSKKSAFDAALLIILASVLSRAVNGSAAFFATLGGGAVLVFLHRLLAMVAYYSPGFRYLIKGKPDEILRDGRLIQPALRRNQIAEDDVYEDLRLEVRKEEIAGIRVARLECSGDVSFIEKTS